MDFNYEFIQALQTGASASKNVAVSDYLFSAAPTPSASGDILPYIQAFGSINAAYPYFYELSQLSAYCLIYTESGMGSLVYDNCCYILNREALAIIDCRRQHRIEIRQSPWSYKIFYFDGSLIPFLYDEAVKNQGNLHIYHPCSGLPGMLKSLCGRLLDNGGVKPVHCAKYILDIMLEVIAEKDMASTYSVHVPEYLYEIRSNFDKNYMSGFSLELLEKEYHISKYKICREFTRYFKVPPINYLNRRRIEAAKEALVTTDKKINVIGQQVGFENTNQFIRLFKLKTGVTPLVYRKQPPAFS